MIEKGTLLKHSASGLLASVVIKPYTKLFRDDSDWEAARHGLDCAVAATAIRILWYDTGREQIFKLSQVRHYFEVLDDNTKL
jgi:hypothetical protein